jgi:hypothetical protein
MPGGHVEQAARVAGAGAVVVDGWHVLAGEVTAQLRRCGVRVDGGAHAATAAELGLDSDCLAPAMVVLVTTGRVPAAAGSPWHDHAVPHLPVSAGRQGIVVGPLVIPGRSPCLACAGAAWPSGPWPEPPLGPPDASTVLAAAIATVTVLTTLRGDHSLGGISTEIGPHAQTFVHRLWKVRDDCRCASVRMAG